MYIFCLVSSVYIVYLFSYIPETCKRELSENTLEEFEKEEKELYAQELKIKEIEKEIVKDFEMLLSECDENVSESKKND